MNECRAWRKTQKSFIVASNAFRCAADWLTQTHRRAEQWFGWWVGCWLDSFVKPTNVMDATDGGCAKSQSRFGAGAWRDGDGFSDYYDWRGEYDKGTWKKSVLSGSLTIRGLLVTEREGGSVALFSSM